MGNRTKIKLLTVLNGALTRARRVHRLRHNPMTDVEKPRHRSRAAIEVFSPEEVWALVRAADSEQDGAIYLTAAFTGLRRGELVALRWRDVDFAASRVRVCGSFAGGRLTTPKSGRVRSVPLAPDVASALARLASHEGWTGDDDLVFPSVTGGYRDPSALSKRCRLALKRRAASVALPRPAAHVRDADDRPSRYPPRPGVDGPRRRGDDDEVLHYVERPDEAALVAEAFALAPAAPRGPVTNAA